MPELESVRISHNWKVSELLKIGKCQKLCQLESDWNCQDLKVSEIAHFGKCKKKTAQIVKFKKLLKSESVKIGFGYLIGIPLEISWTQNLE